MKRDGTPLTAKHLQGYVQLPCVVQRMDTLSKAMGLGRAVEQFMDAPHSSCAHWIIERREVSLALPQTWHSSISELSYA